MLRDGVNLVSSFLPYPSCVTGAYRRAGLWWVLKICLLEESVGPLWCARHPGQSWLCVLSVVCVLCSPGHRHLTDGPLRSGSPLPKAIKMQQLGDRAKWLWKIAPKASYLRCVLFCFVFSICCCPRTKASATDQLHGEMAWPRAKVLHQVVEPRRLLHAMGR